MQLTLFPLTTFMTVVRAGRITGISYIDSTKLQVCHNARIQSHKLFKGLAQRGKTSTGWFYGFKLHIIVNDYGEIISFLLTPGNVSDSKLDVVLKLAKKLYGNSLVIEDIFLAASVTRIKKNMENKLMEFEDKILLNMREMIESVINLLEKKAQVEHTRHRSAKKFLANITAAIVAYTLLRKKSIYWA